MHQRAGMRIHGTTAASPVEMFNELEAACLLGVPAPYGVPVFTRVKLDRDYHVGVAQAMYSLRAAVDRAAPRRPRGQ